MILNVADISGYSPISTISESSLEIYFTICEDFGNTKYLFSILVSAVFSSPEPGEDDWILQDYIT